MKASVRAPFHGLASLAALATATMVANPALADDAPAAQDPAAAPTSAPAVGEIVVTAQRRAQSVMDVPLAISAVSAQGLAAKGVTNSANLAQAVPNLQVSTNFGAAQPNFSMRGISVANEYNSNQVSPVGVYMDDVYLAARANGMGLFDLDRVEVLRGPQGTLFGRNTTGGAINFITRAPSLSGSNGYAEVGYGNFNTFTAQAAAETTWPMTRWGCAPQSTM
jgi:outer membrane receptor protein involved in Fe transport